MQKTIFDTGSIETGRKPGNQAALFLAGVVCERGKRAVGAVNRPANVDCV